MITLDQFVNEFNNTYVDWDGWYGNQCWDLAAAYVAMVIGCPSLPTGPNLAARECFEVFAEPLPEFFIRIGNTPDPSNIPQAGDVIIWGSTLGPDGHIAICLSANANGFVSLDQNWPIGSLAHKVQHNYNSVIGWLRPKAMGLSKEQIIMIHKLAFFGLEPGPGLVEGWVGKSLDDFVNALWSDPTYAKFVAAHTQTNPNAKVLPKGLYEVQ